MRTVHRLGDSFFDFIENNGFGSQAFHLVRFAFFGLVILVAGKVAAGQFLSYDFEDVLFMAGASLTADDLTADNNDAWFVPSREKIEADSGKKQIKQPKEDLPVEILGQPKIWIDSAGTGGWQLQ